MCIICCKKKGVAMPTEEIIRQMWESNKDGAGVAWNESGTVHISKGFMSLDDLMEHLNNLNSRLDLTSTPILIHFRIATHGGVTPQNTHPFPVAGRYRYMKKLTYATDIAVVHNGIIPIKADNGVSDTMTYICKKLNRIKTLNPRFYMNQKIMSQIEHDIKSKMAFLTSDGEIYTIGNFIEENGLLYSNSSYQKLNYLHMFCDYLDMKLLCPIYGYVSIHGTLSDAADVMYMLDRHGNVYTFCDGYDTMHQIDAYAYTYEGLPYRFDEKESFFMYVEENFNDVNYKRNRR